MSSHTFHFLINRILCGPNEILFTLLIFILSKNLHATPFQITVMVALKPLTSLFSFYVSTFLYDKSYRIRPYLIANMFIGALPCIFFPFVENVWFYLASYALFMITKRAQEPAWMEFLKSHLELQQMSKAVSKGTSITYFISMFLPPILSFWLEGEIWKTLFVFFGLLQFLSAASIFGIRCGIKSSQSMLKFDSAPLKKAWQLLRYDVAFSHYLFLFFLGGAGIVALQPILPHYFNFHLGLSYTQLTLAFSFCKGVSFLVSSPIWSKYINRITLYRVNVLMNFLTCLFIGGLLAAIYNMKWVYVAYLCYGAMQGGCDLSWSLSGVIFSKKNDSSPYSSLNLILVGIRGCICPYLGYLLYNAMGPLPVFIMAFCLCLVGIFYGLWLDTARCKTTRKAYFHSH